MGGLPQSHLINKASFSLDLIGPQLTYRTDHTDQKELRLLVRETDLNAERRLKSLLRAAIVPQPTECHIEPSKAVERALQNTSRLLMCEAIVLLCYDPTNKVSHKFVSTEVPGTATELVELVAELDGFCVEFSNLVSNPNRIVTLRYQKYAFQLSVISQKCPENHTAFLVCIRHAENVRESLLETDQSLALAAAEMIFLQLNAILVIPDESSDQLNEFMNESEFVERVQSELSIC